MGLESSAKGIQFLISPMRTNQEQRQVNTSKSERSGSNIRILKNQSLGTSLADQQLRLHASTAGGAGSISGRGTIENNLTVTKGEGGEE